jgi:ATP-binding cassette subfamily C protein CydC
LGETLAAARRIFSLADQVAAVTEPENPQAVPERLDFALRELGFRYQPQGDAVLDSLTLDFPQDHKLAIVGVTGAGKSTLTSLLLRFREPSSGELLLAGKPLAHYSGEALRQHIAVVPQQTHLFNTTLRENLLLAKRDATQVELEAVCRTALIHDFITQQPQSYATWVGETGVRLSGGQAKRVAIARALLKPARLLILDEPTEGLDPETATQVMTNILAHVTRNGQSLLLITHRAHGLEAMNSVLHL